MANDPEIVSDVLFAVANVLSIARTTYLTVCPPARRVRAAPDGVVPVSPYS